ncbi:MAG: pyruvate ferredoxin oxidoreductase, partial [Thermoprotei archaeon]
MVKRIGLNGDEAVALAVKQVNVDVIAAYPITPQTIIVERLSEYVNNGELNAEFVPVESEHSALSTVVGAALAGARVFTATASQGLALMYEILWIASSLRLPIVMAIANRAFSAPINIHCSHDDAMAARDTGWIELFSENVQEAYDLTLQAFMMTENDNVMLPAIVNLDGFILSHSLADLYVFDDHEVAKLVRDERPIYKMSIDFKSPVTYGPLGLYDYYMEIKKQQAVAMRESYTYIKNVFEKYTELSNRKYSPVKTYGIEDAEIVVMALGSMAG